jgi:hypothetical protein
LVAQTAGRDGDREGPGEGSEGRVGALLGRGAVVVKVVDLTAPEVAFATRYDGRGVDDKRRALSSACWKFFYQPYHARGRRWVKCRLCGTQLLYSGSTSNLNKHIKAKHKRACPGNHSSRDNLLDAAGGLAAPAATMEEVRHIASFATASECTHGGWHCRCSCRKHFSLADLCLLGDICGWAFIV